MSDRTHESPPPLSPRRARRPARLAGVLAAALLAGWALSLATLALPGRAIGQDAGRPPTNDPRANSKVTEQPPPRGTGAKEGPGAGDKPGAKGKPGAGDKPGAQDKPGATGEPGAKDEPGDGGVEAARGAEAGMREAFAQLADADADVREAARLRLMSLEPRYLPELQKVVERNVPLPPPQAAVIRQIVTHVYLAGEPYDSNGNLGFLGVRMLDTDVTQQVLPQPGADDEAADEAGADDEAPRDEGFPGGWDADGRPLVSGPKGVVITERFPGFAGHAAFLDGDVIVGLADQPHVLFRNGTTDFSLIVQDCGAGQSLRFRVLRRGRLTTVKVTLGPRPTAADGPMLDLVLRRRHKADAYWKETFGHVLKDRVG